MHLGKTVGIGEKEKRMDEKADVWRVVWGPVDTRRALTKLNTWFTKRPLCCFKTDGGCAHRLVKCSMKNGSSS